MEIDRLHTALRGIQSCSTCEACRGAATLALNGATPEPAADLAKWLRQEASFWRDDAFENAAKICERYEAHDAARDIRHLKGSAQPPDEALAVAMKEAGAKVFGGQWIDHAADCQLGIDDHTCSCGLTNWLQRNESFLGIKLGGAPLTTGATSPPGDG